MRFFPMLLFSASLIAAGSISIEPAAGAVSSNAPTMAISPGMQVVDMAGRPVGIVQAVHGSQLIIKTDRHEVRLPAASFTPDKGKLLFGMTREALNQATDAMLAKALLPGAEVHGRNGALIGAIAAINQEYVTVELQSGERIRLPRNSVGPGPDGAVLGITVAELQLMVKQSQAETP
jgi:preprotein translocase subunit YajC